MSKGSKRSNKDSLDSDDEFKNNDDDDDFESDFRPKSANKKKKVKKVSSSESSSQAAEVPKKADEVETVVEKKTRDRRPAKDEAYERQLKLALEMSILEADSKPPPPHPTSKEPEKLQPNSEIAAIVLDGDDGRKEEAATSKPDEAPTTEPTTAEATGKKTPKPKPVKKKTQFKSDNESEEELDVGDDEDDDFIGKKSKKQPKKKPSPNNKKKPSPAIKKKKAPEAADCAAVEQSNKENKTDDVAEKPSVVSEPVKKPARKLAVPSEPIERAEPEVVDTPEVPILKSSKLSNTESKAKPSMSTAAARLNVSTSSASPLGRIELKTPPAYMRVGLSRNSKVKPLHPNAKPS